MARIKYFNPYTGKWEYADSQYTVNSGDSEPDLVIGMNVANTKVKEDGTSNARNLSRMTVDDVSIISGSVAAVAEKVRQGLPVKVLLRDIHFYWDDAWYQNIGEANDVMVFNRATYPNENADILNAVFFLSNMGVSATEPCLVRFAFDIATGSPLQYRFNKLPWE